MSQASFWHLFEAGWHSIPQKYSTYSSPSAVTATDRGICLMQTSHGTVSGRLGLASLLAVIGALLHSGRAERL